MRGTPVTPVITTTMTQPISTTVGSLEYRIDLDKDDLLQLRHRKPNLPTVAWKDIFFRQLIQYKLISDNRKQIDLYGRCKDKGNFSEYWGINNET